MRRRYRSAFKCLAPALCALILAAPLSAQQTSPRNTEPQVPEKAGKEMQAYYVGDKPPRIDGKLDDEAWTRAQAIDDMVQNDPDNMQPPTERTVVQVAYDNRAVYVAARCFMKDRSKITTVVGRRDTNPRSDSIKMTFDPRHDHLTAYTYDANPSGVQDDIVWFDDSRSSSDYDAVWEVRTAIDDEGWTAEFRIPFSQMRFSIVPGQAMVWGFNVRRDIVDRAETDRWVATPRGVQGFVSRFGHLTFTQLPAPPRRFEVQPFTLGRVERQTDVGTDAGGTGGLDLKMGLGTSATLSAAVNPDFGQVEQDPAVLNLSVFETFFPEKRPFFIEDSRTFVPPYPQLVTFHSRRIGQRPGRIDLDTGDRLISKPDATTILAATKVSGKSNGWTYGGLTAITDREYAKVEYDVVNANGETETRRTERLIEPYTLYNVARVQRDIRGSNIGGIATGVVREKVLDAYTGGIDYTLRWAKNQANWNGHWVATHAPISGVAKNGAGGVTNFNWNSKHLGVFTHYDAFDRNFKNSDIGFFGSRNNKQSLNGGITLIQPDPRKHYRSIDGGVFLSGMWNGDGLVLDQSMSVSGDIQFLNFSSFSWNVGHIAQVYDDLDTRGGPPIVKPAVNFYNFFAGSDSRKRFQLNMNYNKSTSAAGSHSDNIGFGMRLNPRPALQLSMNGNVNWGLDIAQWIKNTDVTGDGVDDNIYGQLNRHVVSLTARGTYAFTRDMTLEAYLQPFVAVGDYFDIRRLAAPNSFTFEPATIEENPDFNNKSFRSNLVYRWEYRRGSTLYLVWNVTNSDSGRPGDFSPLRDLRTGFTAAGTQVFMVKLNYWLGL